MPRLRQVSRSETDSEVVLSSYRRLFGERDPVQEPGTASGTSGNWWTVFALVPDVLEHAVQGFRFYASPTRHLPAPLRELGQTRAGWAVGSQFVFSQHCKSCRAAGISEEKIDAIPAWQVADCFDATERAVLAYTDALVYDRGRVDSEVINRLKSQLPDEAILELTYITSMYLMHAVMSRALRVEFDDRDDPTVEVPAPEGHVARDIGADIAGA